MGRPRTEDQFKKLVNLQAMVTRAEKKRLMAMRKATGLSISAILRAGLIQQLENHEQETQRFEVRGIASAES